MLVDLRSVRLALSLIHIYFSADDDIEVLPGEAVDAVVVNLYIQPVDSMEKLYMSVTLA